MPRSKDRTLYTVKVLLLTSLALGLICRPGHAAVIEGVIFSNSGPVADGTVYAYPDHRSMLEGINSVKSEPGEKAGQYKLELPVGTYYLTATGVLNGHQMFSYHGVNPITVSDGYYWLPFFMVKASEPHCKDNRGQGIGGQVFYRGEAISHGVISVYNQLDGKFRGMGLLTNTLDEEGRFRFDLEPGNYVVIARRKKAERGIGPVTQGDLFCYPSANPIQVKEEQFCELSIECYPRDDLETYLDEGAENPQGRRHEARRQASLWDLEPEAAQSSATTGRAAVISGRVTGPEGQPVPDMVVTAYPALGIDPFQMHILRLITDNMARTDADGNFRIELPGDALYYLQAREKVGAAPSRQELYGLYEGNHNHALRINPGESRENIVIPVDRIMPFSGLEEEL
jgi:hypothetical protein